MVSIFGLNKRIGNISYYDSQGRDMFTKPYSDDTAKIIDEEVGKLIEEQYERALNILKENEDKLQELANRLLTKEVIFKEDLENIFGKRQWGEEESDEIQNSKEEKVEELESEAQEDNITDNVQETEENEKSSSSEEGLDEVSTNE
jgi:cell division protease FtsH